MRKRALYGTYNFAVTLIFCIVLYTPFFISIIQQNKEVSGSERRKLTPPPELPRAIADLKQFPKLFDSYYSDQFGLRDWFVEQYRIAKYSIGDSPSQHVVIGKDGWLFLGSIEKGYTGYSDPIGDARNANLYSKQQLMEVSRYVKGVKSWLGHNGIEYILVITPSKHTIYFENLPSYINKTNEYSATDQLVEHLKNSTNVIVVDLRSSLIKEKEKHQLYYKKDTHWNHFAANIAQYKIMKEVENLFPGRIQPELMKLRKGTRKNGDLARLIGIRDFKDIDPKPIFKGTCNPGSHPKHVKGRETRTLVCNDQDLTAIVFRDSFFTALTPYFSRKFKRSTYIWGRLDYPTLEKYIELENPDVVIEQWVERLLPYIPRPSLR
jgi:hypothetical protein